MLAAIEVGREGLVAASEEAEEEGEGLVAAAAEYQVEREGLAAAAAGEEREGLVAAEVEERGLFSCGIA